MMQQCRKLAFSATIIFATAYGINTWASTGNNFSMLDPTGSKVGGTNDVTFTWDGTLNTSVATAHVNATLASNTPFFGNQWTAHDVMVYGPGTYTIYTGCPAGQPDCGTGASYTVTVNPGQIMAHMLFDWSTNKNIDVIDVWEIGKPFPAQFMTTSTKTTDPWSGDPNNVWTFMSTDWDGDGFNGGKMIDGPFAGFSANFNVMVTADTTGNNFSMLDPTGSKVGGTNDVTFTWDGTLNTSVATAHVNATLASNTPFFGNQWTAHDVMVYGPGTYTIYTGCPAGQPDCGTGASYTVTVNPGQIMAHMLFDWSTNKNIDVIDVWEIGKPFPAQFMTTSTKTTDPWSGDPNNVWTFMSTDWDGDGFNGGKMIDGPFAGFSANFNVMVTASATGGGTPVNGAERTIGAITIADPSFGGGAIGWGALAGLFALLGFRRRKTLH